MSSVPRVLIFSGVGRHADIWHPFEETTAQIAEVAAEIGAQVEINRSTPDAFDDLSGVDVVVINSGGGDPDDRPRPDPQWDAAQAKLAAYLKAGGKLLGTHTAATAFYGWDEWAELFGGAWVRGTSHHPQRSYALFVATPAFADHPLFAGIQTPAGLPALDGRPAVLCYDERYSDLVLREGISPTMTHDLGGTEQVCGWLNGDRVIYDSLGHDARSYASQSRRRLLANELRYLIDL